MSEGACLPGPCWADISSIPLRGLRRPFSLKATTGTLPSSSCCWCCCSSPSGGDSLECEGSTITSSNSPFSLGENTKDIFFKTCKTQKNKATSEVLTYLRCRAAALPLVSVAQCCSFWVRVGLRFPAVAVAMVCRWHIDCRWCRRGWWWENTHTQQSETLQWQEY